MSSGRRRSRSTHAPATSPTSSTPALVTITRTASSHGPAPRTSSATRGTAVLVTTEPSSDTVWPAQSLTKSRCCQRDRVATASERTARGELVLAASPLPLLRHPRVLRLRSAAARTHQQLHPVDHRRVEIRIEATVRVHLRMAHVVSVRGALAATLAGVWYRR